MNDRLARFFRRTIAAARERAQDMVLWAKLDRRREAWLWAGAIAASGATALAWDRSTQNAAESQPADASRTPSADTLIPLGFVLVPIQVSNFESLDSILGQNGVVDLFLPPNEAAGRAVRVARRVKILRSPLDPSHFAVLVPSDESHRLVNQSGAFFVAVQNPHGRGAVFVDPAVENGANTDASANRRLSKKISRLRVEKPDETQNDQ